MRPGRDRGVALCYQHTGRQRVSIVDGVLSDPVRAWEKQSSVMAGRNLVSYERWRWRRV
jgi:hypothetical protein